MYHQLVNQKIFIEGELEIDKELDLKNMDDYMKKNPEEDISINVAKFIAKLKNWEGRIEKIALEGKSEKMELREKINQIYLKFSKTKSWESLIKRAIRYERERSGIHTKFIAATKDVNNIQRTVIAFKSNNQPEFLRAVTFDKNLVGSENHIFESLLENQESKKEEIRLNEEREKKKKLKKQNIIGESNYFRFLIFRYRRKNVFKKAATGVNRSISFNNPPCRTSSSFEYKQRLRNRGFRNAENNRRKEEELRFRREIKN